MSLSLWLGGHGFEGQGEDFPRMAKGFRGFRVSEQIPQKNPEPTPINLVDVGIHNLRMRKYRWHSNTYYFHYENKWPHGHFVTSKNLI
jgi:hypothetical protein